MATNCMTRTIPKKRMNSMPIGSSSKYSLATVI